MELEFRIPSVSSILASLSCVPDSKVQDYGFHCIYFARLRVNYVLVNFLVGVNRVNEFAI